jgi:hypothetical protein
MKVSKRGRRQARWARRGAERRSPSPPVRRWKRPKATGQRGDCQQKSQISRLLRRRRLAASGREYSTTRTPPPERSTSSNARPAARSRRCWRTGWPGWRRRTAAQTDRRWPRPETPTRSKAGRRRSWLTTGRRWWRPRRRSTPPGCRSASADPSGSASSRPAFRTGTTWCRTGWARWSRPARRRCHPGRTRRPDRHRRCRCRCRPRARSPIRTRRPGWSARSRDPARRKPRIGAVAVFTRESYPACRPKLKRPPSRPVTTPARYCAGMGTTTRNMPLPSECVSPRRTGLTRFAPKQAS